MLRLVAHSWTTESAEILEMSISRPTWDPTKSRVACGESGHEGARDIYSLWRKECFCAVRFDFFHLLRLVIYYLSSYIRTSIVKTGASQSPVGNQLRRRPSPDSTSVTPYVLRSIRLALPPSNHTRPDFSHVVSACSIQGSSARCILWSCPCFHFPLYKSDPLKLVLTGIQAVETLDENHETGCGMGVVTAKGESPWLRILQSGGCAARQMS